MRILGIDPGYGRTGWGVVEKQNGDWKHVAHGCIETSVKDPFVERLIEIKIEIEKLIKEYKPTRAGVEGLFFAKNAKTAMKVGQARGVILLTLVDAGLVIDEFTPLQVKQALTGYGRADKNQMQKMVQLQLGLKDKPTPDDAADALAVALTCGFSMKMNGLGKRP